MTQPINQQLPRYSIGKTISAESRNVLVRCFGFLRPHWGIYVGAYVAALGINALAVVVPQVICWIVDIGIADQQTHLLGWAVLGLLFLTFVKGLLGFTVGRWTESASQHVAYDIRNAIHEKLGALSFSYHDHAQTGQLLSRSIQDVERIRFLTGRAVLRLFQSATLLLGSFVALFVMICLALLAMATMPLLSYIAFRFGRVLRPLSIDIQQQSAVLTTLLSNRILRGARIVKAFAQEDAEIERFQGANDQWFALSEKAVRIQALNVPFIDFIAGVGTIFIVWYGGSLVINDQLTLGELVAFTTYLSQLVQPIARLGVVIPAIAMASAAGERIFEILDAESEVQEAANAIKLPPITGHVRFDDVSFSYFGRRRVLENLSFDAQPGQVIALLGQTGSGKSTIINLISRFYDATEGHITIDGYDIGDVTLNSLRDQIGIVLQESTLFAATIRENIAFGVQDADEAAVIEAAKAAQAHDFITAMPDGYETEVGERGITLSGGQKQRIAIARALLLNPRILLLDDATSSVDTETERLIQLALERLMAGRTSFIIAQRLSTVRMADLVLVLENGRIAASGTHDELLNTSGLYAEIYHRQLR